MKTGHIIILIASVTCVTQAQDMSVSLNTADRIQVWDQRISDVFAKPVEISDQDKISKLAALIENAVGEWKPIQFYTPPTGNIRLVFLKGTNIIQAIGVGDDFLVRGTGTTCDIIRIPDDLCRQIQNVLSGETPEENDGGQQGLPGYREPAAGFSQPEG